MLRLSVVPLLLLGSGFAAAQNFEAASVKPVQLMDLRDRPLEGGPGSKSPTRIAGHITMMSMVTHAYGTKPRQTNGPSWMETEFFEIAATLAPDTTSEQEKVMWQNLLKERFHLEAHRETRELPVYALVVGKNGPKLKQSDAAAEGGDKEASAAVAGRPRPQVTMGPDGFPQIPDDIKMPGSYILSLSSGEFLRVKMFCRHRTMSELADSISDFAGRLVQDQTGLQGKYDFTLAFETEPRQARAAPQGTPDIPTEHGVSLSTAVQEQLGLKLDPKKSPVELLVIDRVEKAPSEN